VYGKFDGNALHVTLRGVHCCETVWLSGKAKVGARRLMHANAASRQG